MFGARLAEGTGEGARRPDARVRRILRDCSLVALAACLAAAPSQALAQDEATAFERWLSEVSSGENASEAERRAFLERMATQAEIYYRRAEEAAKRCDGPTMRSQTMLLDRLVSNLTQYVNEFMPGVTVRALATARALLSNARALQLQNCTPAQQEQELNQVLSDPGSSGPLPQAEQNAYYDQALQQVRRLYQLAQAAAARCDEAALRTHTGQLQQIVDQLTAYINANAPGTTVRARAEGLAYLSNIQQLKLENCPKGGVVSEPTEHLTTGPQTQLSEPAADTLPPRENIVGMGYNAWAEGLDAVDRCDKPAIDAALAQLREALRLAELHYARVMSADRVTEAQYNDAQKVMEDIRRHIAQIEKARLDCPGEEKPKTDLLQLGDIDLELASDSGEWCEFAPDDPRDLPVPEDEDDPRDGDTPGGDDPRDADTPGGDDPRDADTPGGDDPRDADVPGGDDPRDKDDPEADDPRDVPVIIPGGDDPRDEDEDEDDPRDEPEDDDPRDEPVVTLKVKPTGGTGVSSGEQTSVGVQHAAFFPSSVRNVALPSEGGARPQTDASADPITCKIDSADGCEVQINPCEFGACEDGIPTIPAEGLEILLAEDEAKSFNIHLENGAPAEFLTPLAPYIISRGPGNLTGRQWITVMGTTPEAIGFLEGWLDTSNFTEDQWEYILSVEENLCRTKAQGHPDDPHFHGKGAWGQQQSDQWAIQRVGFAATGETAWGKLGDNPSPVIVAVIDSGLDWNHLDFSWDNIWRNPGEVAGNGVDDDGNGYVDDMIGWDFLGNHNNPWDHDGHGTLVAGIIAADSGNGTGIAGINPHARVMVLKALNAFGHSRASYIANAVRYAADNGARVINISASGPGLTEIEKHAVEHARSKGAVVIVAAGNDGANVEGYGPAANEGVITVGATDVNDGHPAFSNWGPGIDVAAPGVDVLSLRARRTDTVRGAVDDYTPGEFYVGTDRRYYRATGTSFAAPIVSGIASLVLSGRPGLTGEQLETIIVQSAEDIQTPGRDNFSGAGLVDAKAALGFDPSVRLEAAISGIEVGQGANGPFARVLGTIAADSLASARIEIGAGRAPTSFRTVASGLPAGAGTLAEIPAEEFRGAPLWTIRLLVTHSNGTQREARFQLDVGG